MHISDNRKMKLKICTDGQMLEQAEQFRYLGNSLISEDGYCEDI